MKAGNLIKLKSDYVQVRANLFRNQFNQLKAGTTPGSPSFFPFLNNLEGEMLEDVQFDLGTIESLLDDLQNEELVVLPALCIERKPSGKPDVKVGAARDKFSPIVLLWSEAREPISERFSIVKKVIGRSDISDSILFRQETRFDARFIWEQNQSMQQITRMPTGGKLIQIMPNPPVQGIDNLWFMPELFEVVSA